MNQTVSTRWYVKKCALGALIGLAVTLALLAAASALILSGALGEERVNAAALAATALGAFAGCTAAGTKTNRRAEMIAFCAAAFWLVMQLLGFLCFDVLLPARSLWSAAAVLSGAVLALALRGRKAGKRKGRGRAGRGRR